MKSFFRRPAYYDSFQCIASACTDNCCIRWEIDIDEASLEFYRRQAGTFGERLQKNIAMDPPHFILDESERCPFLNQKNLCDIILNLGEKSICQICTDHPRFYDWYENGMEAGIGLCCEEAAKKILTEDATLMEDWKEDECEGASEILAAIDVEAEADATTEVLAEMDAEKISDRLEMLAVEEEFFGHRAELLEEIGGMDCNRETILAWIFQLRINAEQGGARITAEQGGARINVEQGGARINVEQGNTQDQKEILRFLFDYLGQLQNFEINKEEWRDWLVLLQDNVEKIWNLWPLFERQMNEAQEELLKENFQKWKCTKEHYRRLLCYFIYRYYMKARWDRREDCRIWFALLSMVVIEMMDIYAWGEKGILTLKDQIDHCKLYSQEIEYCEENVEAIESLIEFL